MSGGRLTEFDAIRKQSIYGGGTMTEKECALIDHQNILVATDGSIYSERALDQGIKLTQACNSKLYIIHAIDLNPEYLAISPKLEEKMETDGVDLLKKAKQKAVGAGIRCETIFTKSDPPYKAIVNTAKEKKVNLIVMGSHGRNAITRLLMGSVTRLVIGHAPCAVLVVPK